jgi:hypothetical protein
MSSLVSHAMGTALCHQVCRSQKWLRGALQVDTQVKAGWKGYLCQCCNRAATGSVTLEDIEDLAADRAEAEEQAEAKRAAEAARGSRAASSVGDGAAPAIPAIPEKATKKFLGVELSRLSVAHSPRGTVRKKKGPPTPKQGVTLKFLQVCLRE